jgi:hypothetical protein
MTGIMAKGNKLFSKSTLSVPKKILGGQVTNRRESTFQKRQ